MKGVRVLRSKDVEPVFFGLEYSVGSTIEVYDALSWEPFRIPTSRYRHWREEHYYKGYAQAIGARLGQQIHLVFVRERGNGHNDYRIVAGRRPKLKRKGTPWQRRVARLHKLQKTRKKLWLFDQFKVMESFLPKKTPWSRVYAARKALMEVVDDKKRRYLPGWSAKKVAETEKEKWNLLTSAS
jgi:hypothetical protein